MHDVVLDDGRMKVCEIADTIGISNKRVGYILHEELDMKKLCARWVPRLLTADQKRTRMKISDQCSNFSLTSVRDRGGWSTPCLSPLTPGKEKRYPFYRSLGGRQGLSKGTREIWHRPGLDPRTVQPLTRHYTNCAIPVH